jgi:hypothetical protein
MANPFSVEATIEKAGLAPGLPPNPAHWPPEYRSRAPAFIGHRGKRLVLLPRRGEGKHARGISCAPAEVMHQRGRSFVLSTVLSGKVMARTSISVISYHVHDAAVLLHHADV